MTYVIDANVLFSCLIGGNDRMLTLYVALVIEFDHPLLTRDKPLANGLRAKGFTQVLLLDELLARSHSSDNFTP